MRLLSEGKAEEGLKYLLIAWADEDLWAGELLSYGYTANWFGENDYLQAFRYYKLGYEKGAGPVAAYNLGRCYYFGRGVDKDLETAQELFKEAEEGRISGVGEVEEKQKKLISNFGFIEQKDIINIMFLFVLSNFCCIFAENFKQLCTHPNK